MTFTTAHMSMSLDGFVAGPDQTLDEPIGHGGMTLHRWHLDAEQAGHEVDRRWTSRLLRPRGAYVMGRNMFGPSVGLGRPTTAIGMAGGVTNRLTTRLSSC